MKLHVQAEQKNKRNEHASDDPRDKVVPQPLVGVNGRLSFLAAPARACTQQEEHAYTRRKDNEYLAQCVIATETAQDRRNRVRYVDELWSLLEIPWRDV